MCGIYITNIPYQRDVVEEKLNHIKHRGPDNLGYLKRDNISLGHVRLSIIDLEERSNQPYTFDQYSIVYNGEIYNFPEIKNELETLGYEFETTSDTEVLIKGYAEWEEKILSKLNGMFAFAILDSAKKEVFCARDRLGVKPFYYFWKDGAFEICSQLKPLINKSSTLWQEAISIYLDCGYVPSPFSIIEDVYKLQPGKFLVIDLGSNTKSINEYWNLEKVKTLDISYEDAKSELHNLLIDAVKIRMRSDVPLGTFLSGGIDSALVTAIASKLSKNKINSFTIGFEDPKYDESKVAEQFSKILGTNHNTTVCTPQQILDLLPKLFEVYDEPFADSSALPSLLLNKITKNYVTVALSGDGGDESFLGYNYFDGIKDFEKLQLIPFFLRRITAPILPETFKLRKLLLIKDSDSFIERVFMGDLKVDNNYRRDWLSRFYGDYKYLSKTNLQKAADLNIKLWLENDSNVKVDRASMAYAMEIRSPFLDYRIVEFARNLPIKYRYDNKRKKILLKDILKDYIPQNISDQPKRGFSIPLDKWIKNDLKNEIAESFQNIPMEVEALLSFINIKNLDFQNQSSLQIWRYYILLKWTSFNFNKNV